MESGLELWIDFDGTLVLSNVARDLVEQFGTNGHQVSREIDDLLHSGRITLREAWAREIAVLPPDRLDEMAQYAVEHVALRPGARDLVVLLDRHRLRATVLSGGVDFYIRPILRREGITWPHQSDVLRRAGDGSLVLEHPFGHPTCRLCGICKAQAVRSSAERSGTSVFVGDGSTDRFAAEVADVVFARHRLLTFCKRRGIPARPFETLEPVVDWFRDRLEGRAAVDVRTSLGKEDSACPISSALAGTRDVTERVGQS